ncbi:MAG: hypothetical protein AAGI48_13315 [Verrucomicrobiota bacterium]
MKRHLSRLPSASGFTILESTLVILVLLALVSVLFVSTKRWQRGADKAVCILNQHQVQQAVRGYSNLYGKEPGSEVPGLAELLFGDGRFIEKTPLCPSNGLYSFGGDRVPLRGELYMKCSLAEGEAGHRPEDFQRW